MCEVGAVGKISDCQPEGPGFNSRPGRGLNFGRPSFAALSVDRALGTGHYLWHIPGRGKIDHGP